MAVYSPPAPLQKLHTAGLFLTGLGVCIALLYFGRAFCVTLVISVILAFLLEPFVVLVMGLRIPRGGAAFIVCCIALLGLYLMGFALYTQAIEFVDELPYYSRRVNEIVDNVADRMQRFEQNIYKLVVPKRFQVQETQEPPAELLTKCEEALRGQVGPEFLRSQIEVGTRVCKSLQEARDQLAHLRGTVGRIAGEFGLAPIAASTHPFAQWSDQQHTDKERYNVIARDLQQVGRRLVISFQRCRPTLASISEGLSGSEPSKIDSQLR